MHPYLRSSILLLLVALTSRCFKEVGLLIISMQCKNQIKFCDQRNTKMRAGQGLPNDLQQLGRSGPFNLLVPSCSCDICKHYTARYELSISNILRVAKLFNLLSTCIISYLSIYGHISYICCISYLSIDKLPKREKPTIHNHKS